MRESSVERSIVKYAKSQGWWTVKFFPFGIKGIPDRICIRNGVVLFIEVKAAGEKLRPLQAYIHKVMREHGAFVFTCDNLDDAKRILK